MITTAKYKSINTEMGIKIFRYDTCFTSQKGAGDVIGLVYMMNPGDARPRSDKLFNQLVNGEFTIDKAVITEPDSTMEKVIEYIKFAYEYNKKKLPDFFTIHVENLFNLREKDCNTAKKIARELNTCNNIMFKHRVLESKYSFVWLAWGKDDMEQPVATLFNKYPNAISVHKFNRNNKIYTVDYPVHPLYMSKKYFLEAAKGKIS